MSGSVAAWQKEWRDLDDLTPSYLTDNGRTVGAPAIKNVLMMLSSWADYDTGENAHPGIIKLATASNFSPQVVSWALQIGRQLGWIERTLHPQGRGQSDVYALRVPGASN